MTVAESGGGDVYAGYNGNIYKKTSDGWQRLDNGTWKPAQSSPYVERERPPAPKPPRSFLHPARPRRAHPQPHRRTRLRTSERGRNNEQTRIASEREPSNARMKIASAHSSMTTTRRVSAAIGSSGNERFSEEAHAADESRAASVLAPNGAGQYQNR